MAHCRCEKMDMNLNEQSPLKHCGLDQFMGIEFVCCPDDYYKENNKHHRYPENFITKDNFSKHHNEGNVGNFDKNSINTHHNKHGSCVYMPLSCFFVR